MSSAPSSFWSSRLRVSLSRSSELSLVIASTRSLTSTVCGKYETYVPAKSQLEFAPLEANSCETERCAAELGMLNVDWSTPQAYDLPYFGTARIAGQRTPTAPLVMIPVPYTIGPQVTPSSLL